MRIASRSLLRSLSLLACTASLCLPGSVRAEASAADKAAAEALFDDALNLMRQGKMAEACPKLEQSQRIDPGIGTLLYLAECYEKLGRNASAWATFREAFSAAKATGQTERATLAQERAERLEATLSKLTIQVAPENQRIRDFRVQRAGETLESSLWGLPIPVDPGGLTIEASAPGYETWATKINVGTSANESLFVPALTRRKLPSASTEAPSVAGRSDVESEDHAAPASSSSANIRRAVGLTLGGIGVIGLGLSAYFGVRAISKNSDAEQYCTGNLCRDARGLELTEDAKDAAVLSNIAFGFGAGALGGGLILFLTASPEQSAIRVTPKISAREAGICLGGAL